MDGTGERHLKRSLLDSEAQKSYVLPHVDYRPKTNAAILLDMDHTLRGECVQEE
jgi:hypothetical protein